MNTHYIVHRQTGMVYRLEGRLEGSVWSMPYGQWLHADGFTLRLDQRFSAFGSLRGALRYSGVLLTNLPWTPMRAKLRRKYSEKLDEIMRKEAQR